MSDVDVLHVTVRLTLSRTEYEPTRTPDEIEAALTSKLNHDTVSVRREGASLRAQYAVTKVDVIRTDAEA